MKERSPPVSAMATPTNSSGNLVDEFEEAFQHCLNVLTKEETITADNKEDVKVEMEQTTFRFIDLGRQMEAFFLQRRFLLSALKPEMIVKEDTNELKSELARKEELLKRHHDKVAIWQNLLADMQVYAKSPVQSTSGSGGALSNNNNNSGGMVQSPVGAVGGGVQTTNSMGLPGMSSVQQQMQQMQQMQQIQQMQQMQVPNTIGGNTVSVGPGMVSPQQAIFMQQQAMGNARGFNQQGPGGILQGPLAYLEKTTSNIGITDGRR